MEKPSITLPPISNLIGVAKPEHHTLDFDALLKPEIKNEGPKKIKFDRNEDMMLYNIVTSRLCSNWNEVAALMRTRSARQCRERWNNYLNPFLRNDPWSPQEDELLLSKFKEFGQKWRKISKFFVNRSDNALRNRYYVLERRINKYHTSSQNSEESSN
ncbi:Myb-like DNA-binding domain containing protein [Trichomonas vaginalis G3]|uniref:Myb-like DNA-binding domain containing protein n=1 Tax=Trichomonas vaginalis (strain ATCC PRA-98 / G3) TaxID=412133 RepID=A2EC51_TRIV3|nr:RNA polymerase II transcription regulator recruiting protein [Trichomonas vaginalis G3]EAY09728.1 Myb-like DNA-binding domain containing protein [Trichomonas vaginalis G3]KAI5550869.1 RNA polymerase II transcription regulator recruiting protein [Trichomonas vaginalis G3]|eukprot:XP_001321951.1 Myb-like DNA-binding domain containing protein [Trichomonas vaginalis G3]